MGSSALSGFAFGFFMQAWMWVLRYFRGRWWMKWLEAVAFVAVAAWFTFYVFSGGFKGGSWDWGWAIGYVVGMAVWWIIYAVLELPSEERRVPR